VTLSEPVPAPSRMTQNRKVGRPAITLILDEKDEGELMD